MENMKTHSEDYADYFEDNYYPERQAWKTGRKVIEHVRNSERALGLRDDVPRADVAPMAGEVPTVNEAPAEPEVPEGKVMMPDGRIVRKGGRVERNWYRYGHDELWPDPTDAEEPKAEPEPVATPESEVVPESEAVKMGFSPVEKPNRKVPAPRVELWDNEREPVHRGTANYRVDKQDRRLKSFWNRVKTFMKESSIDLEYAGESRRERREREARQRGVNSSAPIYEPGRAFPTRPDGQIGYRNGAAPQYDGHYFAKNSHR